MGKLTSFKQFLKDALSSDSSVSSKRISGFIGWLVCIGCVIYSVISKLQSPAIVDTLFYTSVTLLGIDSVANIFKKN